MHTALAANGQHSSASFDSARSLSNRSSAASPPPPPPACSTRRNLSVKQQWTGSLTHPSSVPSETVLHSPSSVSTGSVSDCPPSSPSRRDVAAADLSPLRVVSPAIEQEEESAATSLLAPAVTAVEKLRLSEPAAAASSSSASAATRSGRVPLSQVVRSLTERWSEEYLADAEAGDVEAQCLVAQMFMEGWGALRQDPQEGKRWLLRARQGGVGGIVHQLEGRYLPAADRRHSTPSSSAAADAEAERTARALEGGYFSGYGQSPVNSPSQSVADTAAPRPTSFFSSIVNAVAPKLAASPPPAPSAVQASASAASAAALPRSISHDQLLHRPDAGNGSGSSDDARYDALRHRMHSHHQLYTRPHPAHGELASVHAN